MFAVDCGVRQESIFLWRFSSPLFIYMQVYTKTTWCCMRNLPRHQIWSIIISDMKYWKWRKENTKARNKPRYNICSFIYFVFYIPSSLFRKINGVQTNFPRVQATFMLYLNVCSGFRKCTWSRRTFIFYSLLFAGVLGDQRLIYWHYCLVLLYFLRGIVMSDVNQ